MAKTKNIKKPDINNVQGQFDPKEIDVFNAIMEHNIPPEKLMDLISSEDRLVLQDPSVYKEKYQDIYKDNPERFDADYEAISGITGDWIAGQDMFPKNPIQRKTDPYGYFAPTPGVLAKSIATNGLTLTTSDGLNRESLLSDDQMASMNNYYVSSVDGEDVVHPGTVTRTMRKEGIYSIDTNPDGSTFWRKEDPMSELYGKNLASVWGDQKKYGSALMDGIIGFVNGVGVETLKAGANIGKVIEGLATNFDKPDAEERAANNYLNGLINRMESYSINPTERAEEEGLFGGWNGAMHAFGQGLGMLVPQFATAGAVSAAKLGAKALMGATTGVGTVQAIGDVYSGAREAGLDAKSASILSLIAAPAVYATERTLSTPWITKRFSADPGGELKASFKKGIGDAVKEGVDVTKEKNLAVIAKKSMGDFFKKTGDFRKRLKSGEVGIDQIRGLSGFAREASQETLEESWYMTLENLYDNLYATGDTYGDDYFGTKLDKHAFKRLAESFVLGGVLGGLVDGVRGNPKQRGMSEQIDRIIVEKGDQSLPYMEDHLGSLREEGGMGPTNLDLNGQVITEGKRFGTADEEVTDPTFIKVPETEFGYEQGTVLKSQGDINYYNAMRQAQQQYSIYKASGIDNANVLANLRSPDIKDWGVEVTKKGLDIAKQIRANEKETADITSELSNETNEEVINNKQKQIDQLTEERKRLNNDYQYYIQPEEGTRFSKAINDFAKVKIGALENARTETDNYFESKEPKKEERLKKFNELYNNYVAKALPGYVVSDYGIQRLRNRLQEAQDRLKRQSEEKEAGDTPAQKIIQTYSPEAISQVENPKQALDGLLKAFSELQTADLSLSESEATELETILTEAPKRLMEQQLNLFEQEDPEIEANKLATKLNEQGEQLAKLPDLTKQREELASLLEQQKAYSEQEEANKKLEEGAEPVKEVKAPNEKKIEKLSTEIEEAEAGQTAIEEDSKILQNRLDAYLKRADDAKAGYPRLKGLRNILSDYPDLDPETQMNAIGESPELGGMYTVARNFTDDIPSVIDNLKAPAEVDPLLIEEEELIKRAGGPGRLITYTNEDIIREAYTLEADKLLAYLGNLQESDYAGQGMALAQERLALIEQRLGDLKNSAKYNHEIVEKEFNLSQNPERRAHLSKNDLPLPESIYKGENGIENTLNSVMKLARETMNKINEKLGSQNAKGKHLTLRSIEQRRVVFEDMKSKLGINDDAFNRALGRIKPFTQEDAHNTFADIEMFLKRTQEAEKGLFEIKQWIYKNKDTVFTDEAIEKLYKDYNSNSDLNSYILINDSVENPLIQMDAELAMGPDKSRMLHQVSVNTINAAISVDPLKLEQARAKYVRELLKDDSRETEKNPSTFEQEQAENELIAFILNEGKAPFVEQVNKVEYEWFKQSLEGRSKAERDFSMEQSGSIWEEINPNWINVLGDYATGKTEQVGKGAIRIAQLITGKKMNIGVVANNPLLGELLQKSFTNKEDLTYGHMTDEDFLKKDLSGYDFLVWDESSLLLRSNLERIEDKTSKPIIFMGDVSQMADPRSPSSGVAIDQKAGTRTSPIKLQHTNDLAVLQAIAYAFKSMLFSGNNRNRLSLDLPKTFKKEIDGKKYGGEYFGETKDLVNSFIADKQEKALIFFDEESAQIAINDNPKLLGQSEDIYFITPNIFNEKPFVELTDPVSKKTVQIKNQVIQGLRKPNVYIGFNPEELLKRGYSNSIIGRAGYTSAGRSRGYIGLIGSPKLNAKEESEIVFGSTEFGDDYVSLNKKPAYQARQRIHDYILGEKAPATTPVTPTESKTWRYPKGKRMYFKNADTEGVVEVTEDSNQSPTVKFLKGDTEPFTAEAIDLRDLRKSPNKRQYVGKRTSPMGASLEVGQVVKYNDAYHEVVSFGTDQVGDYAELTSKEKIYESKWHELATSWVEKIPTVGEVEQTLFSREFDKQPIFWGSFFTAFDPGGKITKDNVQDYRRLKSRLIQMISNDTKFELVYVKDKPIYYDPKKEGDAEWGTVKNGDAFLIRFRNRDMIDEAIEEIARTDNDDFIREAARKDYGEAIYYLSAISYENTSSENANKLGQDLKALGESKLSDDGTAVISRNISIQRPIPGKVVTGPNRLAIDLVDDLIGKGFHVDSYWQQDNVRQNDKLQKALVKNVGIPGYQMKLIGYMPKITDVLSKSDVKEILAMDMAMIESAEDRKSFNSNVVRTFFFDFLKYNRANVQSEFIRPLLAQLAENGVHIDKETNFISFGKRTEDVATLKNNYKKFVEYLSSIWESDAKLAQMYYPAKVFFGKNDRNTFTGTSTKDAYLPTLIPHNNTSEFDSKAFDMMEVAMQDLHYPSAYFRMGSEITEEVGLLSDQQEQPKNQDEKDDDIAFDHSGRGYGNIDRKISMDKAVRIITDILGPNALLQEFDENILTQHPELNIFGYMENGYIGLNDNNGVVARTPRHEASHIVFNYALNRSAQNRLRNELQHEGETISLSEANERLGDLVGLYEDSNIEPVEPKSFLGKVIQWIKTVAAKLGLYRPTLRQYIEDFNSGFFAGWQYNVGGTVTEQMFDSEQKKGKNDDIELVYKVFDNDATYISRAKSYLGKLVNKDTPFNNDLNEEYTSVPEAIYAKMDYLQRSAERWGNKEVTLNDQKVPVSTIESHRQLTEDDAATYFKYKIMEDPKLARALVSMAFKDYDLSAGLFNAYADANNIQDKQKVNPDNYLTGALLWQMEITPVYQYDADEKVLAQKTNEYLKPNDIVQYLHKAGIQARQKSARDGTPKIDNLIMFLDQEASNIQSNNKKQNQLKSFIHRFFRELTVKGVEQEGPYSFHEQLNKLIREGTINERTKALANMMGVILNFSINSQEVVQHDMQLYYNEQGELSYDIYERTTNSATNNRRVYLNQVRNEFMDTNAGINQKKLEQLNPYGDVPQEFSITPGRLSRVVNDEETGSIVNVEKGKYSFGEALKSNGILDVGMLKSVMNYLGLKGQGRNAIIAIAEGKSSNLKEFLQRRSDLSYSTENFGEQYVAEAIYHMFNSVKLYGSVTNQVKEAVEGIEELSDKAFKERRAGIVQEAKQGEAYKAIHEYMKKSGEWAPMNSELSEMKDEDEQYDAISDVLPTPSSFFNFWQYVGLVNEWKRSDSGSNMIMDLTGESVYAYKMPSHITSSIGEGSIPFANALQEKIKKLTPEELANVAIIDKNGVPLNRLIAVGTDKQLTIDKMVALRSVALYKGTNNLSTADAVMVSMAEFVEGLTKSIEEIRIPYRNIGDSGLLYYMFGRAHTDKNMHLFQNPLEMKDGKILPNKLNQGWFNDNIDAIMKKEMRKQNISLNKTEDFLENYEDGEFESRKLLPKDRLKKSRERVAYLQKTLDDIAEKHPDRYDRFVREYKKGNHIEAKDYLIEDGRLVLGRAANMNGKFYNNDNFDLWNKAKNPIARTKARNKIFGNELITTLVDLSRTGGFGVIRNMTSEMLGGEGQYLFKSPEVKFNDIEKLPDEERANWTALDNAEDAIEKLENQLKNKPEILTDMTYNPLFEAFFYVYHIFNNHASDFVVGDWTHFDSNAALSKRTSAGKTPKADYQDHKMGLQKNAHVIIYDDLVETSDYLGGKNKIGLADGEGYGNSLFMELGQYNMGGDLGTYKKNAVRKTLAINVDPLTGDAIQIKHAVLYPRNFEWNNDIQHRYAQEMMFNKTDEIVSGIIPEYERGTLNKLFKQSYAKAEGNYERAMEIMADAIIKMDRNTSEAIRSNLVWHVAPLSTVKYGARAINSFDLRTGVPTEGVNHVQLPLESVGEVLNAEQNVDNFKENVRKPKQIHSYTSMDHNKLRGKELDKILGDLFTLGEIEYISELNKIEVDPLLSQEDQDISRMDQFLRRRGINLMKTVALSSTFAQAVLDPNRTIDITGVRDRIIHSYINYINETMVDKKMDGVRMVQVSGHGINVFVDSKGREYMPEDMKKRYGLDLTAINGLKGSYTSPTGAEFSIRRLQPMKDGNPGEVVAGFSHSEQFGKRPGETLADLFSVYMNGEYVDLRGMSNIAQFIQKNIDAIEVDKSPSLRKIAVSTDQPGLIGLGVKNYISGLEKLMGNVFAGRVPATRLGSGHINKMVGIIDGSNKIYLPPEQVLLDDADYDIDMKGVYYYRLNDNFFYEEDMTDAGLNNKYLRLIGEVYTDPKNKENIFFSSDVADIRNKALNIEQESKVNSYGEDMVGQRFKDYEINKAGDDGIGILASFTTTIGVLARNRRVIANMDTFKEINQMFTLKGKDHPITRSGDWAQSALDNEKFQYLGKFGLTTEGLAALEGILGTKSLSGSEFVDYVYDFMTRPEIAQFYKVLSRRNNILSRSSDYNQFDLLGKKIEGLTDQLIDAGIDTEQTIEQLEERLTELEAKRQDLAEKNTLNVYFGANDNPILSNLAKRPFSFKDPATGQEHDYLSVEHAYQTLKSGTFDQKTFSQDWVKNNKIKGKKALTAKGYHVQLMENLIKSSFEANPKAKEKLLATGDAIITHDQDKGYWKTKFPEVLMNVREELGGKGIPEFYKETSQQKNLKEFISFKELEKYLVFAETMRRLSTFVSLRNKLKVMDSDSKLFNHRAKEILGMTPENFIDGVRKDPGEQYAYWEKVNEEVRYGLPENAADNVENQKYKDLINEKLDRVRRLKKYEKMIKEGANIAQIIRGIPYLNKYTKAQLSVRNNLKGVFIEMTENFKDLEASILNDRAMSYFRFKGQDRALKNALDQVLVDQYFKHHTSPVHMRITEPIRKVVNKKSYAASDNIYNTLDLSDNVHRNRFRLWFPQYVQFLQDIVDESPEVAIDKLQTAGWSLQEANQFLESTKENTFFDQVTINQTGSNLFVDLIDANKIKDEDVSMLKSEFHKLPTRVQELFAYNQLINRGLFWGSGKLVEVVNDIFMDGFSQVTKKFNEFSREKRDLDGRTWEDFIDHFKGYLQADTQINPYLSKDNQMIASLTKTFSPKHFVQNIKYRSNYKKRTPFIWKEGVGRPVYKRFSTGFDLDRSNTTELEPVKGFTADELNDLLNDKFVLKPYILYGHRYLNGNEYMTTEGVIIKANVQSKTAVTWTIADTNETDAIKEQNRDRDRMAAERESGYPFAFSKVLDFVNSDPGNKLAGMEIDAVKREMARKTTAHGLKALFSQLNKITGLSVVEGTRTDSNGVPVKSWVDEQGVGYDLSQATLDNPIHEFSHIWIEVLQRQDNALYELIMDRIQDLQGSDLWNAVARAYPELSTTSLSKEVMAHVAGFYSTDIAQDFARKHGIDDRNFGTRIYSQFRSFINQIIDAIKRIFGMNGPALGEVDFVNGSLRDIFTALAKDYVNGNINLSDNIAQDIFTAAYGTRIDYAKNMYDVHDVYKNREGINTLNDFDLYLGDNSQTGTSQFDLDSDDYVNMIYASLKGKLIDVENEKSGKKYIYVRGGITYEFSEEEYRGSDIKRLIKQRVVNDIKEQEEITKGSVVQFIKDSALPSFEIENERQRLFVNKNGKPMYSTEVLTDLVYISSLEAGNYDVMKYSDLKKSKNEKIRNLHIEGFEGKDPVVIIHGITESEINLSILDVTNVPTGLQGLNMPGKGLLSTVMTDSDYYSEGGRMTNKKGDIRRMMIGMQVMGLQKQALENGMTVKFNNLGVIQLNKDQLETLMIPDIDHVIHHIDLLRKASTEQMQQEQSSILEHVKNKELYDVIMDDNLYKMGYGQSFMSRLKYYLENTQRPRNRENIQTILSADASRTQIKEAMMNRMRELNTYVGKRTANQDYEFQLLGLGLMETETGQVGFVNSLEDMSGPAMRMLESHNVNNEVLQWIVEQAKINKQRNIEQMTRYTKRMDQVLEPLADYFESGYRKAQRLTRDLGGKYFERLYTTEVIKEVETGNEIETKIPYIHWDLNNPATKRLFNENKINEIELRYANAFLDEIEKGWIDLRLHIAKKTGADMTTEEAKYEFDNKVGRGWIPVIQKSSNELVFGGDVREGVQRFMEKIGNSENAFEDLKMKKANDRDKLSFGLFEILADKSRLLEAAGIAMTGDTQIVNGKEEPVYQLANETRNKRMSTNLQNIGNYFEFGKIRKINYENNLLPVVNSANAIFNYLESFGNEQTNNRKYFEQFIDRMVFMRNADDTYGFSIGDQKVQANEMVRTFLHASSFLSLGFKPVIWIKSFLFNELNSTVNSLASSISNIGIDEENRNQFFGAKEYFKAHSNIMKPQEFKKARRIAYLYQLIDSDERDMLESPFRVRTDRNLLQEKYAHIGNWGTDAYARIIAMMAQMMKEGSWDAHTYNSMKDEVTYDEKQDTRFYKDGKLLTDKGQHVIRKDLIERLKEQGIQEEGDKLTRGHDYILADTFKYLSDRFVIGSMSPDSKVLLGNHYIGAAFTQFRMFSWAKLANAGLAMGGTKGKKRMSRFGTSFKAVKDENGEWISVKELHQIEGAWQSFGRAYREMIRFHRMTPAEFWKNSSPQTRMNLARSLIQATTIAVVYALIKGFDDPDDELRFNWILGDLSAGMMAGEFFKNPFPMVSNGMKLVDAAFGRDNFWKKAQRYIPGEQFITAPLGFYKYYSEADERAAKKDEKELKRLEKEMNPKFDKE